MIKTEFKNKVLVNQFRDRKLKLAYEMNENPKIEISYAKYYAESYEFNYEETA